MKLRTNYERFILRLFVLVFVAVGSSAVAGSANLADLKGTKISMDTKQGKIIEIMDAISSKTEYTFIYEDGIKSELNKKVEIQNGENLHDILSDITQQSDLEFRAVNNNIVVKKRSKGKTYNSNSLQNRTITGKITSAEDDSGLPGVNIIEKGTSNGTVSDIDGNYSLEVPGSETVLVFSSVGFLSEEIVVGTQSVINLSLSPDITALDEVVVTALGIERETKSLGYDVGNVEGDAFREVAQENVLNSLAGRVSGVQINQTSGAGSTVSVVIRGATSLTTDNQPLFVVDGVFMSNSLNNVSENGSGNQVDYGNAISDINPDDIESVTVLKGPSAAALYGTRAGNGVVIITTKSGSKGKKFGVDVSTNTLFETPTKLLEHHYKYANGERPDTFSEGSAYWGGPELDAGIMAEQFGYDGPAELRSYPNNMKEFLQTGITSTNSIALNGGGENGMFRVSYANTIMKGMIPNHDRFLHSFKTNITYNLLDNLKFNTNFTFNRSSSNDIPSTGDRRSNPLQAVYQYSHLDVRLARDYWEPGMEQVQQRWTGDGDNPYFIAYGQSNAFIRDRLYGNASLTYDFTSDLSLMVRYGLDTYAENRETKVPFSNSRMPKGHYSIEDIRYQESNADFLLSYNKVVSDWDISASFGGNIMNQIRSSNRTASGGNRRNGLVVPGIYNVGNIPLDNISVRSRESEKAIYSLYALASIGYKGQVYLDVTGRNDWSSTLPPDSRSYFYPSVSLSWLANYTFDLPENVSLLKLRGGWAQVGNDTDPYRLEPTLVQGSWNTLPTQSVPGTLLNPELKPEELTSTEFGLDFNMFNDRLRFAGTYYMMDNRNQIFSVEMPRSSGYSGKLINAGLISSKGWEFTIGGTPIQNSGLTWDIDFNITRNRSTVEELPEGLEFITLWRDEGAAYTFVGEQIGDLYSWGYAQVEDPNSPYYRWPILSDDGGWQVFRRDPDKAEKVGNFNPDFMLGMQTRFSFGRFSVAASLDWRSGGEFASYTYRYGESDWKSSRQLENLIPGGNMSADELAAFLKSNPDEYIIPQVGNFPRVGGHTAETGGFPLGGQNDGAFIPGVIQTAGEDTPDDPSDDVFEEHLGGPGTNFYPITDTYPWRFQKQITFDASFVKLRELTINYRIPVKALENLNVGVYTRNLMLWTKSKIGIDPERAFQAHNGTQGDTSSQFRQGIERQNVMPWSASIGFKLGFSF